MKQELLQHRFAYFILFVGLLLFTFLFLGAWPQHWLQRMVAISTAAFYASWGIVFHLHHQRISKQVVKEYLAVSCIAAVILFIITA